MEKLIIDVPKGKAPLVKQLLEALGVKITPLKKKEVNKEVLTKVSVWSDDDIKVIEEASGAINKLDIKEW
ncbi:hypothetical protein GCM10028791_26690 [Echinicola sediminis]